MEKKLLRIDANSDIQGRQPCIKGMRFVAFEILDFVNPERTIVEAIENDLPISGAEIVAIAFVKHLHNTD